MARVHPFLPNRTKPCRTDRHRPHEILIRPERPTQGREGRGGGGTQNRDGRSGGAEEAAHESWDVVEGLNVVEQWDITLKPPAISCESLRNKKERSRITGLGRSRVFHVGEELDQVRHIRRRAWPNSNCESLSILRPSSSVLRPLSSPLLSPLSLSPPSPLQVQSIPSWCTGHSQSTLVFWTGPRDARNPMVSPTVDLVGHSCQQTRQIYSSSAVIETQSHLLPREDLARVGPVRHHVDYRPPLPLGLE